MYIIYKCLSIERRKNVIFFQSTLNQKLKKFKQKLVKRRKTNLNNNSVFKENKVNNKKSQTTQIETPKENM